MDSSLWWMIVFVCIIAALFVVYLFLSTCLGPPLIRAARAWLATHYRASKRDEWDAGGGGYREVRRSGRANGFMEGRGGAEGYEMATFGEDD
ncbi:hypothetical protein JCM8097_009238 [Rhodosporidiobolus ruineniae]